jgi:hypothetical protein
MITYSVTVTLDREIELEWLNWMKLTHVPDVMATGCFLSARITRLLDPVPETGSATFNMQYVAENLGVYKRYYDNHAPALQQDFANRYEGRYVAIRTLLRHEAEF